ncbi:5057_t:CDS:2 [Gigaspora rosea]|nr:5057_t:CDS:2 [Gigaspora rosea]
MLNFSRIFATLKLSLEFISSRIIGPSLFTSYSMLFGSKFTWHSIFTILPRERPCKNHISVSASGPAEFTVVVASSALVLANFSIGHWSSSSFPFASSAVCNMYIDLGTIQALLIYIIWLIVNFLNLRVVAIDKIIALALATMCFFLSLLLSYTPKKRVTAEDFSS